MIYRKTATHELIIANVKDTTITDRGFNCWLSRSNIIDDRLLELMPDSPEDGDIGKIAYEVPNKDRMKIKTGKFLTRKLNLNSGFLSDQSLQDIGDKINRQLFPDSSVQLVHGPAITHNYEQETGARSCMTTNGDGGGPDCTLLYENNPKRFRMLVMHYLGDSARAIVHTFDDGRIMMDRVYASSVQLKIKMMDYAHSESWLIGYNVDTPDSGWTITGLNYCDGEVPYMDTMMYGSISGNLLDITAYSGNYYALTLTETDGHVDENGVSCCSCGEFCSQDDQYSTECSDIYCQDCFNELYAYCECCDENSPVDDFTHIEDKDIYVCDNCAIHNYYRCADCGEYFGTVFPVNNEDCSVCESCLYGNYCSCESCGEYFTELSEDNLCDDCAENDIPVPVSCKVDDTGVLFGGSDV